MGMAPGSKNGARQHLCDCMWGVTPPLPPAKEEEETNPETLNSEPPPRYEVSQHLSTR